MSVSTCEPLPCETSFGKAVLSTDRRPGYIPSWETVVTAEGVPSLLDVYQTPAEALAGHEKWSAVLESSL